MKHTTLLKIHLATTALVVLTISAFFISSLVAELSTQIGVIKSIKRGILYALPLLVIGMPILGITGKKLAGRSQNPIVLKKKQRMKVMMINGLILSTLVVFLFYQSNFREVNGLFYAVQTVELAFGLVNISLIGFNIRDGLRLSARLA